MRHQRHSAILFIHGILGTPNHFAPFLLHIPPEWSICNILLKGHGGGVRDFSRATMAEWKNQVQYALDELLKEHDRVLIVAHSMGTLFAIQEAIKKPIAELLLLAAQAAYSIERDRHILRYIGWIPRYLELFVEIRKTRKIIARLSVPSHIYFSLQDEMVSPKSRILLESNAFVTVKALKRSGHFYYSPEDQFLLIEDFKEMIRNADQTS